MNLRDKIADAVEADFYAIYRGDRSFNDTADAILAVIAESVEPLQWLELNDPIGHPEPYQIWRDNGGSGAPDDPLEVFEGFMLYNPHMSAMGVYSSIEDAKAAAQADYTRRILSSLGIRAAQ